MNFHKFHKFLVIQTNIEEHSSLRLHIFLRWGWVECVPYEFLWSQNGAEFQFNGNLSLISQVSDQIWHLCPRPISSKYPTGLSNYSRDKSALRVICLKFGVHQLAPPWRRITLWAKQAYDLRVIFTTPGTRLVQLNFREKHHCTRITVSRR